MIRKIFVAVLAILTLACSCKHKDGEYKLDIYAVSDVHGRYFSESYTGGEDQTSISNVSAYINEMRKANPELILIDNGDNLQGDNAAYYFNYIETGVPHLYARITDYLKFDAVVVGNHDIEPGHAVYDRLKKEYKMPLLAANAVYEDSGKPYFQEYTILRRGGLKVALIGMVTPCIGNWLPEEKYKGIDFLEAADFAQNLVDRVIAKEKPDVVILSIHAGTGSGRPDDIENPSLWLAENLQGVDLVIAGHDHTPAVVDAENFHQHTMLMNSADRARNVAHCEIVLTYQGGKPVDKHISCDLIPMAGKPRDAAYEARFAEDFEKAWPNVPMVLLGELNYVCTKDYVCDSLPKRASHRIPMKTFAKRKNMTFVYSPVYMSETIDLICKNQPYVKNLYFVTGEEFVAREIELNMQKVSKALGYSFTPLHPREINYRNLYSLAYNST